MASVGSIVINLKADLVKFTNPLSYAERMLRKFAKQAMGVATSTQAMLAGIAGLAGIGGLGYMTKRTIDSVSAINDMSLRLGVASEALFGLKYAADLSGSSIEAIETAASKLAASTGDALTNSAGTAAQAFKVLGIDAEALQSLSLDQQFLRVSDALQQVRNSSERIYLVRSLFGRGGMELLSLLGDGSKSLRAMMDEAKRLGATLGAFDTRKIDDVGDSFTRVGAALRGAMQRTLAAAAPYIEALANVLARGIADMTANMPALVASAKDMAIEWGIIADKIKEATDNLGMLATKQNRSVTGWVFAGEAVRTFFGRGDVADWFDKQALRVAEQGMATPPARKRPDNMVSRFVAEVEAEAAKTRESMKSRDEGRGTMADLERVAALMEEGEKLTEALRTPAEKFRDSVAEYSRLLDAGAVTWDTYLAAIRSADATLANSATAGSAAANSPRFAAAMERGSTEAYSAVLAAQTRSVEQAENRQLHELRAIRRAIEEQVRQRARDRGEVFSLDS